MCDSFTTYITGNEKHEHIANVDGTHEKKNRIILNNLQNDSDLNKSSFRRHTHTRTCYTFFASSYLSTVGPFLCWIGCAVKKSFLYHLLIRYVPKTYSEPNYRNHFITLCVSCKEQPESCSTSVYYMRRSLAHTKPTRCE